MVLSFLGKEIIDYIYLTSPDIFYGFGFSSSQNIFSHFQYKTKNYHIFCPQKITKEHINPKNFHDIAIKHSIAKINIIDILKSKNDIINISDHINRTGYNFLRSKTPYENLETFPDMTTIYSFMNGEVVTSVGSSFINEKNNSKFETTWIAAIAPVWKYIGVKISGFACTKEIKFNSIYQHIKKKEEK